MSNEDFVRYLRLGMKLLRWTMFGLRLILKVGINNLKLNWSILKLGLIF